MSTMFLAIFSWFPLSKTGWEFTASADWWWCEISGQWWYHENVTSPWEESKCTTHPNSSCARPSTSQWWRYQYERVWQWIDGSSEVHLHAQLFFCVCSRYVDHFIFENQFLLSGKVLLCSVSTGMFEWNWSQTFLICGVFSLCSKEYYSETCDEIPLHRTTKRGLIWQVVFHQRYKCIYRNVGPCCW